jgi:hypothetical protein
LPQEVSDCLDDGRCQKVGHGGDFPEQVHQTTSFESWLISGEQWACLHRAAWPCRSESLLVSFCDRIFL